MKAEGDASTRLLAEQMAPSPEAPEVQVLIARHRTYSERFLPASAEAYAGLGQGHTAADEFGLSMTATLQAGRISSPRH